MVRGGLPRSAGVWKSARAAALAEDQPGTGVGGRQDEGKIRGGNILISVHAEDSDERGRAKGVLERNGATDIVTMGEAGVPSGEAVHLHKD